MRHMNMREGFTFQEYVRPDGTIGKEYTQDKYYFVGDGGFDDGQGNHFPIPDDKEHSKRWGRKSGTYVLNTKGKPISRTP